MEVISIEGMPIIAGILLLAMFAAVVVNGWLSEEQSYRKAEGPALRKAA